MATIKIVKEPDFYQAVIINGTSVEVVDGIFEDELSARVAASEQLV